MDVPRAPRLHPEAGSLADVRLVLCGALGGDSRFGTPPIPADLRAALGAHPCVVVLDEQGAPIAAVQADGRVHALDDSLDAQAAALTHPSQGRPLGVLLDRPLLRDEVEALRREQRPLLLLVRTATPLLPADVLLAATRATARGLPDAVVAGVPFAPRDDAGEDEAISRAILATAVAEPWPVAHGRWPAVRDALDRDDDDALRRLLDDRARPVLRRWRPPRAERGLVVLLTGLSGSGKSTLARLLTERLQDAGRSVTLLDGDVARRMLSAGLGFDRADRETNVRRLGWVAAEVARHGGTAVLAPIAPYARSRREVRRLVRAVGDLVLVWVSTPLEVCERRDRKGLYRRARHGEIPAFTGVSDPYEPPEDADVVVDTSHASPTEASDVIWAHLRRGGWLGPGRAGHGDR